MFAFDDTISKTRVELYTTSTASDIKTKKDCYRLRALLEAKRITFTEVDLATQLWKRRQMLIRSDGKDILPQLHAYGKFIGDLSQVQELEDFGELDEAIQAALEECYSCPPEDPEEAEVVSVSASSRASESLEEEPKEKLSTLELENHNLGADTPVFRSGQKSPIKSLVSASSGTERFLESASSSSLEGIQSTGSLEHVEPGSQISNRELGELEETLQTKRETTCGLLEPRNATGAQSSLGPSKGAEQHVEKPSEALEQSRRAIALEQSSRAESQQEEEELVTPRQGAEEGFFSQSGAALAAWLGDAKLEGQKDIISTASGTRPTNSLVTPYHIKLDQASRTSSSAMSSQNCQVAGGRRRSQPLDRNTLDLLAKSNWHSAGSPLGSRDRSRDPGALQRAHREASPSERSFDIQTDDSDGPKGLQILHFSDEDLLSSGYDLEMPPAASPAKRRSPNSGVIRGNNCSPEDELARHDIMYKLFRNRDLEQLASPDSRFKILDSADVSDIWDHQIAASSLSETPRMQDVTSKSLHEPEAEARALDMPGRVSSEALHSTAVPHHLTGFNSGAKPDIDCDLANLMMELKFPANQGHNRA